MTGMDVLRRCRSYEKDMERLKLRRSCVHDAATRLTRIPCISGHNGDTDKIGEFAAKIDEIEREMDDRTAEYARDIALASQIVALIDPSQGRVLHLYMVRGMTIRQVAAELHISESSVRGLLKRGRVVVGGIEVENERGCPRGSL